ncbi:hypothetical protein AGMMS49940_08190 [Spirochaetia bacterium]|nr:hypothetical protein AGMMS49940_08190 [Spirochaetia bacterium]
MNICIDLDTQEIFAVELTGNDEADVPAAKKMLEGKTKKVESFSGAGAYNDADFQSYCYREFLGNDINQIVPPPKNAVVHPRSEKILTKRIWGSATMPSAESMKQAAMNGKKKPIITTEV